MLPIIASGRESGAEEIKNQHGNLYYLSVAAAPLLQPAQAALNPKAAAMAQRPVFRPKLAAEAMTFKLQ